jgi:TatD DNase family protein
LIDTHAHLDFPDFKKDLSAVLERAAARGVSAIVSVGIDEKSSSRAVAIAAETPWIWATVGIHPHESARVTPTFPRSLKELAFLPGVVAIGEMGLDYYRDHSPRDVQQRIFRTQIDVAREVKKPVVIHCRDAYDDLAKIMVEKEIGRVGGILHCFSGDESFARKSLDLGLYISIAGPVTYPRADRLRDVVRMIPLDRLLVETDAPFLTPQPYRGKRNEPSFIHATYERIAALKGISPEELQRQCRRNFQRLLGISISR